MPTSAPGSSGRPALVAAAGAPGTGRARAGRRHAHRGDGRDGHRRGGDGLVSLAIRDPALDRLEREAARLVRCWRARAPRAAHVGAPVRWVPAREAASGPPDASGRPKAFPLRRPAFHAGPAHVSGWTSASGAGGHRRGQRAARPRGHAAGAAHRAAPGRPPGDLASDGLSAFCRGRRPQGARPCPGHAVSAQAVAQAAASR
jgi:hypothetical protein